MVAFSFATRRNSSLFSESKYLKLLTKVNGVSSYLVPKKSKTWKKNSYEGATSEVNI